MRRVVRIGLALLVTEIGVLLLVGVPAIPPLLVVILWTVLLVAGLAVERFRYKPIVTEGKAPPGWRETDEAFVDSETGAAVRVWFDPATGERTYMRRPSKNEK